MPIIKFNNLSEVAEHPQAKLLGWELLSSLFNQRLNELEVSMLEKGVDEIGLGNLLSLMLLMDLSMDIFCPLQAIKTIIINNYITFFINSIGFNSNCLCFFCLNGLINQFI